MSRISATWWLLLIELCCAVGCTQPADPQPDLPKQIGPEKMLTAVVVDDERFGDAMARRWTSEGNGTLKVVNMSEENLRAAKFELRPEVDVIVFANRLFGDLIYCGQLLEIDESAGSLGINRDNMLAHYRENLTRYGSSTMALPLGSPQLAFFYRPDQVSAKPPRTWAEFTAFLTAGKGEVAELLEPLSGAWAAHSLLARVAPTIR